MLLVFIRLHFPVYTDKSYKDNPRIKHIIPAIVTVMHVWCFIQDHGMSEIFTGAGEPDQQPSRAVSRRGKKQTSNTGSCPDRKRKRKRKELLKIEPIFFSFRNITSGRYWCGAVFSDRLRSLTRFFSHRSSFFTFFPASIRYCFLRFRLASAQDKTINRSEK